MNFFFQIKKNLFSIFQTALIVLLVVLVVVFAVVMIPDCPEWIFNRLGIAGTEHPKYEALKFLGIGMGGVLVALQALMSYKRAKAMEKTSEAQADAAKAQADAVSKTEQGQRQDRLKNAIEHLGHDKDSVRLGGAYELFHLAKDTLKEDPKEKLSQTVFDILCAHVRQTTGESKYREAHKSKPSEEVQSLLKLLFVQEHEIFKGLHIDLQGSWLNGADLKGARLEEAVLTEAHLQEAQLDEAHLQRAKLSQAYLQGASLSRTYLQGTSLIQAHLQGAFLLRTRLQGAILYQAHLQGAILSLTCLQGADINEAYLQGASLDHAYLQGAALYRTDMRGAYYQRPLPLSLSFAERLRERIDKKTDLSTAIFSGGLSQENVDSLVKDLPAKKANVLREILEPHIGKPPINQLPENSGSITGSYTAEEAEQWIAEYEQATSKIPEDDS